MAVGLWFWPGLWGQCSKNEIEVPCRGRSAQRTCGMCEVSQFFMPGPHVLLTTLPDAYLARDGENSDGECWRTTPSAGRTETTVVVKYYHL